MAHPVVYSAHLSSIFFSQVRVLYTRDPWDPDGVLPAENAWGWVDLTRYDDKEGQVRRAEVNCDDIHLIT